MIEIIEEIHDTINTMNLSKHVKRIRKEKDWSMYRLAKEANVSETAVHNTEYGIAVNFMTVTSIIDALGYELTIREKR